MSSYFEIWSNSKHAKLKNTKFRKLALFPSSGEGREIHTLLDSLEKETFERLYTVGISLPSPEYWNTFSFRNVVLSSYLELRMMSEVYKASDSDWKIRSLVQKIRQKEEENLIRERKLGDTFLVRVSSVGFNIQGTFHFQWLCSPFVESQPLFSVP
jgi:hypothetical protein